MVFIMWHKFKEKKGDDKKNAWQGLDTPKKGSHQLFPHRGGSCEQGDGEANLDNCRSECWGFHQ